MFWELDQRAVYVPAFSLQSAPPLTDRSCSLSSTGPQTSGQDMFSFCFFSCTERQQHFFFFAQNTVLKGLRLTAELQISQTKHFYPTRGNRI